MGLTAVRNAVLVNTAYQHRPIECDMGIGVDDDLVWIRPPRKNDALASRDVVLSSLRGCAP